MDSETRIRIHCKAVDAFEAKNSGVVFDCYMDMEQEAKRLQSVSEELLAALRRTLSCLDLFVPFAYVDKEHGDTYRKIVLPVRDQAVLAISKAEGADE